MPAVQNESTCYLADVSNYKSLSGQARSVNLSRNTSTHTYMLPFKASWCLTA